MLKQSELKENPSEKASILSLITFWWMTNLFMLGKKRMLQVDDLYKLHSNDTSQAICEKLEKNWNRELATSLNTDKKPSLINAVIKTHCVPFFLHGFSVVIKQCLVLSAPIMLKGIVGYFENQTTLAQAYGYAAGLALISLLVGPLHHRFFYDMDRIGFHIRAGTCALIYKKVLRLSQKSLASTTTGHIVNLGSTDVLRFDLLPAFLHYIWIAPVNVAIVCYLMWREVGVSCFVGLAVILISMFNQLVVGRSFGRVRAKTALLTDKRVRLMNEILVAMRIIKLYTWEKPFMKLVRSARRFEAAKILASSLLKAFNFATGFVVVRSYVFGVIIVYVALGGQLTSSKVFAVVSWIHVLRIPLGVFAPLGIEKLFESRISFKRIETFLLLDELRTLKSSPRETSSVSQLFKPVDEPVLKFNTFSASWEDVNFAFVSDERTSFKTTLNDLDISLHGSKVVAVIGPVGSGKSSFLSAILDELPPSTGNLLVSGRVSYVSQVPWIFSGTIKENILFGETFNAERYKTIIEACALEKDLNSLDHGDNTLVGERGVTLSGGQKARVNLARATYRENVDIILMDDPLSAVDATVAKQLFDECICGFLKDKMRILVTHQLQFITKVDEILVLEKGKLTEKGTFDELSTKRPDIVEMLSKKENQHSNEPEHTRTMASFKDDELVPNNQKDKDLQMPTIAEEARVQGTVRARVYTKYLSTNIPLLILLVVSAIANHVVYVICDWWLAVWANRSEEALHVNNTTDFQYSSTPVSITTQAVTLNSTTNMFAPFDTWYYGIVFAYLTGGCCIMLYLRSFLQHYYFVISGIRLHNKMFEAVVHTHIRFFDTNPVGRILNRFSKDLGQVDEMLPWMAMDFSYNFAALLSSLILAAIINYLVLVVVVPLAVLSLLIRNLYVKTSRDIKRMEGAHRSPVFSHLSSTLEGLTTVRALKMQETFVNKFHDLQDMHSVTWTMFMAGSRWFGCFIDLLGAVFIGAVAFCTLLSASFIDIDAGTAGLTLTYATMMLGMFQWIARLSAEVENMMTSVERIQQYQELPPEASHDVSQTPIDSNWPTEGAITFESLAYAHYTGGPDVLHEISFQIQPQEKVGIVGRTGAGKSSLISTLFRLNGYSQGEIYIDNVAISRIALKDLRSAISIIPQDPLLFAGSLRKNLDPFSANTDEEIWSTLKQVQMKDFLEIFPAKLEMEVAESGSNFSVGQRQLICLARAILRKNKILVIDEATANVDLRTDRLIQHTILSVFQHCTVLTVAHRIHTIIGCDRVMVLDSGKVVEFEQPHRLLLRTDSFFSKMVDSLGKTQAAELRATARKIYEKQSTLHHEQSRTYDTSSNQESTSSSSG